MRLLCLFSLLLLVVSSAHAEGGKMSVVGSAPDSWGSTATVSVVELGRDSYLAITISNAGKEQDATAIVTKGEVRRVMDMCSKGAKNRRKVKADSFEIIDGLSGGGEEELHVVLVTLDGKNTIAVLQAVEHGRERNFVLDSKSVTGLNSVLKKAAKKL